MKIIPCEQNSLDWLEARAGLLTASEAKQILTPKFKVRTGEMPRTLLATKLAERWIGPLPGFTAWATEQGQLLEETAIPAFEFEFGVEVDRPGFITTDDGRCGCSPDGMLDGCGLEIKSLQPTHHCKCLMDGDLPEDYAAQIHFSMFVTGLPKWKLFLYQRRFPCLVLDVIRDEEIQTTIGEAAEQFLTDLDLEYARLVERNGGPPPERKRFVPSSADDPSKALFQGTRDDDLIP